MENNNPTSNSNKKPNLTHFMLHYGSMIVKFSKVLNLKFSGRVNKINPISFWLKDYLEVYQKGTFEQLVFRRNRLNGLLKQLERIEKYDPSLIKLFRKKIRRLTSNEFYRERLEIHLASELIDKQIPFKKTESPDFSLNYNSDIFIECTSCHFQNSKTQ